MVTELTKVDTWDIYAGMNRSVYLYVVYYAFKQNRNSTRTRINKSTVEHHLAGLRFCGFKTQLTLKQVLMFKKLNL